MMSAELKRELGIEEEYRPEDELEPEPEWTPPPLRQKKKGFLSRLFG
jgi:hypothetical protein